MLLNNNSIIWYAIHYYCYSKAVYNLTLQKNKLKTIQNISKQKRQMKIAWKFG